MSDAHRNATSGRFPGARVSAVKLSTRELVRTGSLGSGESFPLLIEPAVEGLDAAAWANSRRDFIESALFQHGALLFRGFGLESAEDFERFASSISSELLDYMERAASRRQVATRVFTSTEYSAAHTIPMHHEMSYSHHWPKKIFFFCAVPPDAGGRTPLADDRKVIQRIPQAIQQRFLDKRVMYVRNYSPELDPWQEVFQTEDRAAVEKYCRDSFIFFEWRDGNRLRTRQVRQVVATHPVTGHTVWFNHAHMFHISNVESAVRESLLATRGEEDLPRNAYYGDGSPIEPSVLDEIRGVYEEESRAFSWQKGDVLLVDNFLASHGREPFSGRRQILVAMAELFTQPQ